MLDHDLIRQTLSAALRTGGSAPPRGHALFQAGARKLTFPRERWPWFAWLAACLFVLDIAARRLALGRARAHTGRA